MLILVALVAPTIVAAVVWGLLLAVGVYELLYVTGLVRHLRMVLYSAVMAFAVSLWSLYGAERSVAMLGLLIFWILLFSEMMANHVKVDIEMIAACFFAGAVVPYLLSAIIRILTMTSGRYLIAIPFLIAFLSDGGAYFVGSMFGKHKLAPVISPNKSVEGVAGGIVAAMLGMLIYAVVLQLVFRWTMVQPCSMAWWAVRWAFSATCAFPWSSGCPASRISEHCFPATAVFMTASIPWLRLLLWWRH